MADGGETDTVHLKRGLQSICRLKTIIALRGQRSQPSDGVCAQKSVLTTDTSMLNVAVRSRAT